MPTLPQKSITHGELVPVRLFLDTYVWLDLAGSEDHEPLLGSLETLCSQRAIEIVVPQIVRDEFARNKDRVIKASGKTLAGALKRAQEAVWTHSNKRKRRSAAEVLGDIALKLNDSPDNTAKVIARIEKLFAESTLCETNAEAMLRASNRALQKKKLRSITAIITLPMPSFLSCMGSWWKAGKAGVYS